ncbi:glycosylhydrolase-like jelly roll fold domain-containing protein [Streptomyces sp. ME19-01-6]|uniref:glycosylhydrolase-like jelly roll fold domain-containing protein n=1 Tax=Streptomyces sp. ME19-01-6 TaxID=3028686 RepID=UPI0029AF1938|nr:glycosyl hydrolase [Streptomyces sp. ME19-01-6]MDX3232143.1 glycosyl hydrolase [Streptomyces sp. ME19-01-6]
MASGAVVTALGTGLPGAAPAHAESAAGFPAARFADPRRDSRPTVYWYWNGPVTHELIDRQMAELRDKGMYEVVIFPFDNAEMSPVFFSEGWFDAVGHVLAVAERTGMRVWVFNDNHFPSGRAAGLIVNGGTVGNRHYPARPELRLKALWRSTTVVEGPATVDLYETTGVGVESGRLVADAAVLGGAAVLRRGARWGDCTVTGSAKAETAAAGLLLRASATGDEGYVVEFDQTGVVTISRRSGGERTELARSTRTDGFNRTKFHTLRVTVSGATLAVRLDDRDKGTVTDDAHPAGSVGVHATGTQRALWEDLTVTAADGTVLYREDFADPAAPGEFAPRRGPETAAPVAAAARPVGAADATRLVELTERLRTTRRWEVPAGRWQIDVFGGTALVDDTQGYSRAYVDLLDEKPVELLLDMVPGEYHRRFGRYFGTVVPGFWDDEPFFASAEPHFKRLPWSPTLEAALRAVGAEPGRAYAALFDDGLGREGRVLRGRFWQAVSDRFALSFRKQARWHAERRVALITNPLYDETAPAKRIASTGDLHKINQWAQIPGGDIITGEYEAGKPTMIPRNPASAAHQAGRERVLLEAFGNMGWQVAPAFAHALLGAAAARGVNMTVLHALWTDETRVYFPPPFGPRAPWWWAMRPLADWTGRVMESVRGTSGARTALIQPQRAAEQWRGTDRGTALDTAFGAAARALESAQTDFDLVHEGALSGDRALRDQARTDGDTLAIGHARYAVAVLPDTPVLDAATARTLAEFARGGGTVLAVGELPGQEAGGDDAALRRALRALFPEQVPGSRRVGRGRAARVADPAALGEAVRAAGAAAAVLDPPAASVLVLRTTSGRDTAFLLNNESAETVVTEAVFPVGGAPQLRDPATGAVTAAPVHDVAGRPGAEATRLPLRLRPYETLAVVFRAGARARPHLTRAELPVTAVTADDGRLRAKALADAPGRYAFTGTDGRHAYRGEVQVTDPLRAIALDGDWTLTLERDGAEPVVRPLGSWTDLDPRFSGSATYTKDITLTRADLDGRRLHLDLGEVREVARVTVGGTALPPALWAPYTVDVTDHLRPGVNSIAVRVANTLANERGKALPSGLLGPVALRPLRPVTVRLTRAA